MAAFKAGRFVQAAFIALFKGGNQGPGTLIDLLDVGRDFNDFQHRGRTFFLGHVAIFADHFVLTLDIQGQALCDHATAVQYFDGASQLL